MDLSRYARLNAFPRPTPFEEMKGLRRKIGCKPRIFVKRDDLTSIGMGGNKNRKLDFVMALAVAEKADVIITTGAPQSNHCRQTLANARRLGLDCHLVLTGPDSKTRQGNLLLDTIMDANLHFIEDEERADAEMKALADILIKEGRRPYIVPLGASTPVGALGYIESVQEVVQQAAEAGIILGHAFLATGSGGTQAGAEVGARVLCPAMRIHGVSVSRKSAEQSAKVARIANDTFRMLSLDRSVEPRDVIVHDEYYLPGYGIPNDYCREAIAMLASAEGLFVDPVYTGKALAGMIDLLRKGQFDDSEAVLFFHTGGVPAMFAHAEDFQEQR